MDAQSAKAPAEILSFIGAYNKTIDKLGESKAELDFTLAELERTNRELVERQDELVEARKLTAMRLLASEIAHEINNPLSTLSMFLGVCNEELPEDDPKKETIAIMLKEMSRCRAVLSELVDFARKEPLKLREVNPVDLLKDALKVVRGQNEGRLVHLAVFCSELPQKVLVDPVLIHQALVNVLNNAYQFTQEGGCIEIEGYSDCETMVLEVKDSGPGIPADNLPFIFEPFFSTTKDRGGTGLGLAITKKIVERHNGSIEVESRIDEETVFRMRIPATWRDHDTDTRC
jgi:signal transduction histidine kinase